MSPIPNLCCAMISENWFYLCNFIRSFIRKSAEGSLKSNFWSGLSAEPDSTNCLELLIVWRGSKKWCHREQLSNGTVCRLCVIMFIFIPNPNREFVKGPVIAKWRNKYPPRFHMVRMKWVVNQSVHISQWLHCLCSHDHRVEPPSQHEWLLVVSLLFIHWCAVSSGMLAFSGFEYIHANMKPFWIYCPLALMWHLIFLVPCHQTITTALNEPKE